ncbi:hypothetical protein F9278_22115 [Streptomyces phaeolivaceus]|uniref:Uncharacterized protein n=1 Tax=Streptomyces phaeolivaceus TaxID=2653200 RepID=A0A5P8K5R3_9ACTN|nr:hypothetical protein [Streptomyces phaeolivaceus]QFQ98431.1 hypothetical protein F9278_22115 [Streptomyces phaeolivaceus]
MKKTTRALAIAAVIGTAGIAAATPASAAGWQTSGGEVTGTGWEPSRDAAVDEGRWAALGQCSSGLGSLKSRETWASGGGWWSISVYVCY